MLTEDQIQNLIDESEDYSKAYFVWQMDEDNSDIEEFFTETILPDLDEYVLAICLEDDCFYSDAEDALNSIWRVLTNDEADELAREYAQYRLEEELYHVPKHLHDYFNEDAYIEDAIEERGYLLNYVDGEEYSQTVNGTTYYLYRVN